jgi:FkbM family methyltransferase
MRRTKNFVKSVIRAINRAAAVRPAAARAYLRLAGCVSRYFPNTSVRNMIFNQMTSVSWPQIELPPKTVEVCPGSCIKLIPHFEEFDFRAQFDRKLNYEREVFEWLRTRQYTTIVEIGANVGVYSIFLSSLLKPGGKVLAFEPSVEAFRRLLENLRVNGITNVQPFQCAIAEKSGLVNFFEPHGHLTNGSLHCEFAKIFSDNVGVSTVVALSGEALAQLVPEGDVLVKIDVEGAEEIVLRGMEGFIRQRRPDLLLEVLPGFDQQLDSVRFLKDLKYRFYNLKTDGPLEQPGFIASEFRDYALTAA